MTKQIKQNIFEETKENIISLFDPHLLKIILYGSYARNDETNESDIDFLVLTDLNDEAIRKLDDEITRITVYLTLKYDILFSFIIINKDHYNEWLNIIPFYTNVSKEGIVIYGR